MAGAIWLSVPPAGAAGYPCCSEAELVYSNGDVRLAGVVLEPYAEGDFPGAVIIQGSGYSDRDNQWARLIAETIAAEGFAVLLTDKRGSGRSEGDWWTASFHDLAYDALAGVAALRARDHVRSDLVGLVGLSQGGRVAPLAATLGDVEFVISLVSGAVPMKDALFHELEQTYRGHGLSDAQIDELQLMTALSFRYIETGEGFDAYARYRERMTRTYGEAATRTWPALPDHRYWTFWRLIHDFDSLPYWRATVDGLGIPSFVAYGALDEQDNVPVARSIERLRTLLDGDALTLRVYPDVGHDLRDGDGLVAALVEDLDSWLEGVVGATVTAVEPPSAREPVADAGGAAATAGPAPTVVEPVWILGEELCEPETVVHDAARNQLYVSNICGFAPNGEGYLSRVDAAGRMLEARWVEGLDSPAGMALFGDLLYVADYRRVTTVDVVTGRVVGRRPVEGAGALNDVVVTDDGTIYVSDSARGHVVRIAGESVAPLETGTRFQSANGLHLEDGQLIVGGQFLWRVDPESGRTERFGPDGLLDIDGIEGDGEGGLVVSVVGGPIWHLPAAGEPTLWATAGLGSTNHLYLPESRLVIVPTGYDGTLVAFRLPRSG